MFGSAFLNDIYIYNDIGFLGKLETHEGKEEKEGKSPMDTMNASFSGTSNPKPQTLNLKPLNPKTP